MAKRNLTHSSPAARADAHQKKSAPQAMIRLRGVRQNNLKNFDLDIPAGRLVVVCGPSGSGKSSLAFDTLYAEGQRRYIETFSPYARQFFDRMDKPAVDRIDGIPPAIAIEQRNTVRTTRSTVGTMTEICEHIKQLWPRIAVLHCRQCGRPVNPEPPQAVWHRVQEAARASGATEALVLFSVPLSEKLSLEESLELLARQGYRRLWIDDSVYSVEEARPRLVRSRAKALTVVQDRLELSPGRRARFVEACEQAYHFGKGRLLVRLGDSNLMAFSNRKHCAECDIDYPEPSPAMFSFNHPVGACPACRGFGRIITLDYERALPDRTKTLAEGVVKPWQSGMSAECQEDLMEFCRKRGVPTNIPFCELPEHWQRWVIDGDPDYGKDAAHQWPHCWYGLKGYFRWLESKSYKMHMRVLLSRYRVYKQCPECGGGRLKPDALLYKLSVAGRQLTLPDFYRLPLTQALEIVETLAGQRVLSVHDPLAILLMEVRARLRYLVEIGLGYLTLDRPTRTLSGGETERVNLAACLGTRLVNTLFVLDEPSVGLHPRDTKRLVRLLERLRDTGNTVVVVEHEPCVLRAADQLVELGPGHGQSGGQLVFQGTARQILRAKNSITGQYLSGKKQIPIPQRRPVTAQTPLLELTGATLHNLQNLSVSIPLGRFVCVTGVSGSGKTTLVREVLWPALCGKLQQEENNSAVSTANDADNSGEEAESESAGKPEVTLKGFESLGGVVMVDQSPLGRTPRSNPAVYIGAFTDLRKLLASSQAARELGLDAGAFSFNSPIGQCPRCRGAGFEKIEMQFLSDVFVSCPDCQGRRYKREILQVTIRPPGSSDRGWNVARLLDATVDEALDFLAGFPGEPPAQHAAARLRLLQETGLGYLRLGQPLNTLSGGESQRLKLVGRLVEFASHSGRARPFLFIFDEPTTGLHFDDIRVLLQVFQRLVNEGHSLLVIEHNLELIKCADWVIDLGPEAGEGGGRLVACGAPEQIMACQKSHTGAALREVMQSPAKQSSAAASKQLN